MNLKDKCALITGASRGIGRAIAIKLASEGVHVAINYLRSQTPALETARAIEQFGVRAVPIKGNVADRGHLDCIFKKIEQEFGRMDIVVSNAASGVLKPAVELTERHWHWTMDINAGALLGLIQHAMPLMGGRGGRVIAVSSLGAVRAIPDYAAVGASKAALESLVRHLAVELAPRGINVNAVSAGVVETDALKHFPTGRRFWTTPAGARRPAAHDAGGCRQRGVFLCTPLADMIHGQTLVVDGGYSIVA